MRSTPPTASSGQPLGPVYPPGLAAFVHRLLPQHPALTAVGASFAEVLGAVFFASLQTEEGAHHTIRVALLSDRYGFPPDVASPQQLRFRRPCNFTARNLLRLARAAHSERLLITVAGQEGELAITGLAREGFEQESTWLKIRAPAPGCLEVWSEGRRVLEYTHGYVQTPPEDLLLASGQVREKLLRFAREAHSPAGYIQTISSLVHHLADHPHGGIMILSAEAEPYIPPENSFVFESETHLWDALKALDVLPGAGSHKLDSSERLRKEALRAEIERVVSEVGRMTALDGATILDRHLAVRGFGVVLPVRPDIAVVEVLDAAATVKRRFPVGQYGARHRAAASYAATWEGSLVFLASASGDIGCLMRDRESDVVLLWRFRAADLSSTGP